MPETKTKLLIVDDEPSVRTSMSQVLTAIGYQVRSAEDGLSALVAMRNEVPSILLSDLVMPGMSGHELLSVVRRRFPSIQVVAMSGAFCGDEVPSGVAADAFYQKGSSVACLLKVLEALPRSKQRPTRRATNAFAPIWIQQDGQSNEKDGAVSITCPECLRTFRQAPGSSIKLVQEADCQYCRSVIHYAIVQAAQRASMQVMQRARGDEMAPITAPPQFYY
jgi:DNA-binding NtrC family response regulator